MNLSSVVAALWRDFRDFVRSLAALVVKGFLFVCEPLVAIYRFARREPAGFGTMVLALATTALAIITWRGQNEVRINSRPVVTAYVTRSAPIQIIVSDASSVPAHIRSGCFALPSDVTKLPQMHEADWTPYDVWIGGTVFNQLDISKCSGYTLGKINPPTIVGLYLVACYTSPLGDHYVDEFAFYSADGKNFSNMASDQYRDIKPVILRTLQCK